VTLFELAQHVIFNQSNAMILFIYLFFTNQIVLIVKYLIKNGQHIKKMSSIDSKMTANPLFSLNWQILVLIFSNIMKSVLPEYVEVIHGYVLLENAQLTLHNITGRR